MITIIAIIGWTLFVLLACVYFVGLKDNVTETTALSIYVLGILLSDEFRDANRSGFERALREARAGGMPAGELVFRVMKGVIANAKGHYKKGNPPNSLTMVIDLVEQMPVGTTSTGHHTSGH